MVDLAAWPPERENRTYHIPNMTQAQIASLPGVALPAKEFVADLNKLPQADQEALLESTQIYTDLPAPFYQAFLSIQAGENPINLPKIQQNKNVLVRSCFLRHPSFTKTEGLLHPSHWEQLGWPSKQAYEDWLDSSMLFAFSHCMHYCSAPRVFDADEAQNKNSKSLFHFKKIEEQNLNKKTNILSVTGFEFRSYSGDLTQTHTLVQEHSKKTMEQILKVSTLQEITDLIIIPFGLGVFLPPGTAGQEIKNATYRGWIQALNAYQGPALKIHLCASPETLNQLQNINNPNIKFIAQQGIDAYVLANKLQDEGPNKTKTLMINAADNDWTSLLDQTRIPGQFSDNHTLFHPTADEYLALVTGFAYFSIQKLIAFFKEHFPNKVSSFLKEAPLKPIATVQDQVSQNSTSIPEPLSNKTADDKRPGFFQNTASGLEPRLEPAAQSSLDKTESAEIQTLIRKLEREIKSRWPYPHKSRKQIKVEGLKELITLCDSMQVAEAIDTLCSQKKYCELKAGVFSTRTADLLNKLQQNHAPKSRM